MYKNKLCLMIALTLIFSQLFVSSAFALNYSGSQGNEATFETLEETRESSPAAVANLETNVGKEFKSHPVLDGYPEGTTYVYRSANLYGGRASARQNTNLVVFAEQAFESKDTAFAYLEELGLIAIADEAIGSVVLVTPADKTAFGAADQKNYYKLQTAMFAQKASEKVGDVTISYSDAEYFGGYSFYYVIGIDGGATFINNYISSVLDYVSRIGGMLLVNGKMDRIRNVAACVPVYLVNASATIIDKYEAVNKTDALFVEGEKKSTYNQTFPERMVVIREVAKVDLPAIVNDAYYNLFIHAQRSQALKQGLNSASTPYQGYSQDSAPYSLVARNAVINNMTADGLHLIKCTSEDYSYEKTAAGEYLQTWFEYIPEEVLEGTAPKGSIPVIVAMHGGGDDPRMYVDEIGLLELAGKERIAIIAPEHMYIGYIRNADGSMTEGVLIKVIDRFMDDILAKYPAFDASRVYTMGYSMGGGAALRAVHGAPTKFAAVMPMATASYDPSEEEIDRLRKLGMPCVFLTSEFDFGSGVDYSIGRSYLPLLNLFLGYNELDTFDAFDFQKYPIIGFKTDTYRYTTLNGEYGNHSWYVLNDESVPMVGVNVTDSLIHALFTEYGKVFWNFAKHYSRNPETGEIAYNPFAE
jgi:pimeloyl-ACP methyl ester carboxylesterase